MERVKFYNLKAIYGGFLLLSPKQTFCPVSISRRSLLFRHTALHSFNKGKAILNSQELSPAVSFFKYEGAQSGFFYGTSYLNTLFSHLRSSYLGVLKPYFIKFSMKGVGYRVWQRRGRVLFFKLGFTHRFGFFLPRGVHCKIHKYKFLVFSRSKTKLTQLAKFLLNLRFPDPYKGKGIRYSDDRVSIKSRLKDSKKK